MGRRQDPGARRPDPGHVRRDRRHRLRGGREHQARRHPGHLLGLTKQDYDTLTKIAPVVAYPQAPWATPWRDIIKLSSQALGLGHEGDALHRDHREADEGRGRDQPQLAGKSAMFVTHIDPTDLSKIGYYTTTTPGPSSSATSA